MKKYVIFDTETMGIDNPVIYDIAWRIVDREGVIYQEENFAVREIITNPDVMINAYYHKKIYSNYIEMLASGMLALENFNAIMIKLNSQIKRENATVISAYNLGFDLRALKATNVWVNNKYNMPISSKLEKLDIWQMACETFLNTNKYKKAATNNGWVSNKGNYLTNAEVAYRYMTNNNEFIEDHTALSDVIIEQDILLKTLSYKKKQPKNVINGQPWRIVNS